MVNATFVSLCWTFIRYLSILFYFSFPSNPFTRAEWISIVARERRDDVYKPAKNSVICSDHFDKLDISGNTNRHRLVKTAVPKLQVHLIIHNRNVILYLFLFT